MKIEWNKVTWYSKVVAVVLFVATFYVGFYLGEQNQTVQDSLVEVIDVVVMDGEASKLVVSGTKEIKEDNFVATVATITGSGVLAEMGREYIDNSVKDFKKQADRDVPQMMEEYGRDIGAANYNLNINAKYLNSSHTESLVFELYMYTGGANGNAAFKVFTVDNQTGKLLTLNDLVKKDKQVELLSFVKKSLNKWTNDGSSPVVFDDVVADLSFGMLQDWSMDDKNIYVYFDKYEVAPGVAGDITLPLPLTTVGTWLN